MENASTINPLWQFSVSLYKQPAVADYCIALQDKYDALVNLALFYRRSLEQAKQISSGHHLMIARSIREQHRQLFRIQAGYQAVKTQLLEEGLNAERQEKDILSCS